MTREEAKDVFLNRGWIPIENGIIYDANKWRESVAVISRWLEQEPCEDAISRQAVLDKMKERDEELSSICPRDIRELPPVTPQQKTGHWRPIYQGDEIIDYRCSECEFGSTFGKSTHGMKYCPRCGAKMVEPQESEG